MAKLESDARFMKITGILILLFLGLVTGLLISLHLQLRQSLSPATLSQEIPASAHPSPGGINTEVAPVTASAPLAPPARLIARRPVATSHYMREESKTPPPKEEIAAPDIAPLAPEPEPSPVSSTAQYVPPSPAPESKWVETTVPSGAVITVRLLETLDSQANHAGDRFRAALDEPLYSDGQIVAPRGKAVEGHVKQVQQAGRVSGLSEITLELDRLLLDNGQWIEMVADTLTRQGEPSRSKDAATVGSGAAIGAAIGAIAGGRRGAGIGAATGAGAGTAQVLLTRGKPVVLSPETRLSFQLRAPLHLTLSSPEATTQASRFSRSGIQSHWKDGRPILRRQ